RADGRPSLLHDHARRLHRERVVDAAGKLVHGREVSQPHAGKSRLGSMAVQEALPRWDLAPFFPAPASPEVERETQEVAAEIASLRKLVDGGGLDSDFDTALRRLNELTERFHLLYAYLACEVAVDSRNEAAQARLSRLTLESVAFSNLETRITAWL